MILQKLFKSIHYNGLYFTLEKAVFKLFGMEDYEHSSYLKTLSRAYQILHEKKTLRIRHFLKDILFVINDEKKTRDSYLQECKQLFLADGLTYSTITLDELLQFPYQDFTCAIFYHCSYSDRVRKVYEILKNNHKSTLCIDGDFTTLQNEGEEIVNISNESAGQVLHAFRLKNPHIAFVLPSTYISGGVMVVLTHASFLQNNGWIVDILVSVDNKESGEDTYYCGNHFHTLNYLKDIIDVEFDLMVATQWGTVDFVQKYHRAKKKIYFVQNYETDFYPEGDKYRISAEATYHKKGYIEYYTMSHWCQKWLKNSYDVQAEYVPNGIFTRLFDRKQRNLTGRKTRILIEGDCALACKNVDESFRITAELDREQFEVWYLSYNGKPKEYYGFDQFFHKIPYQDVHRIYEQCDILIKSSVLESFSYPPLEMMATGGFVVLVENEGNVEYIKNEVNCLTYPLGNIESAVKAVQRICTEDKLRNELYLGACQTADSRDWSCYEKEIVALYTLKYSAIRQERDIS